MRLVDIMVVALILCTLMFLFYGDFCLSPMACRQVEENGKDSEKGDEKPKPKPVNLIKLVGTVNN